MSLPSALSRITNGVPELLKRFQGLPFTCEYKYVDAFPICHLNSQSMVLQICMPVGIQN